MARNKKQGDKFNAPFATSLRQLIEDRKVTQGDIASITGVTRQTVSQYCNGISEPGYDTLIKIADYFNVSIDYLLGRTGDPNRQASVVDELGLSPAVVEGIKYIKNQSKALKSMSTKASHYPPIDPLSGLNLFLEDTLPTGLYNEIYMLTKEVEREAQATRSAIEVESEDIYNCLGKLRGDSLVMHELEGMLIEKYPELEGRVTVLLASFKLESYFEGIIKLFTRCLKSMTGYDKVIK